MNYVVADASFCAAWVLEDECSSRAEALLQSVLDNQLALILPALWHYEMYNLLVSASRRGRLSADDAAVAAEVLGRVPIQTVEVPTADSSRDALDLALRHGLSVYDAAYLELSIRLQVSLYTLDKDLEKAARAEGVSLSQSR